MAPTSSPSSHRADLSTIILCAIDACHQTHDDGGTEYFWKRDIDSAHMPLAARIVLIVGTVLYTLCAAVFLLTVWWRRRRRRAEAEAQRGVVVDMVAVEEVVEVGNHWDWEARMRL